MGGEKGDFRHIEKKVTHRNSCHREYPYSLTSSAFPDAFRDRVCWFVNLAEAQEIPGQKSLGAVIRIIAIRWSGRRGQLIVGGLYVGRGRGCCFWVIRRGLVPRSGLMRFLMRFFMCWLLGIWRLGRVKGGAGCIRVGRCSG